MKIVVFGANGGIGRHVVEQALAAGHLVTAVVRGTVPFADRAALQVQIVPDLFAPDVLVPCIAGHDAVLCGVGPRSLKGGPVASRSVAAILAAMHRTGVRRLVAVSAAPIGAVPADEGLFGRLILYPLARTILRPIFVDLAAMELSMWGSGLDCTSVRPPRLTDGPRTIYRRRVGGSVPNGTVVSRADTADAMLAVLSDSSTIGVPVGVAN